LDGPAVQIRRQDQLSEVLGRLDSDLGILCVVGHCLCRCTQRQFSGGAVIGFLGIMVGVLAIWGGLAISIKRWHDRGKSGWWIFIGAIPIIGGLWVLIETGFLEGDPGPNQYGPNPLDI
jgi:uncharacterized membrane protein YhaH (DUF805 family)